MSENSKRMVVDSELERDLIFRTLLKMKEPVELEIGGSNYPGHVKRIDQEHLVLLLNNPPAGEIGGPVRAHFVFHTNYHYFDAEAQMQDNVHIELGLPDKIFKNMLRLHERIAVEGRVFLRFKILMRSQQKALENPSLFDERVIMQEVSKPKPGIDKILGGIKQLLSDAAQSFQVKIFKAGGMHSFEEEILKRTKKIFLLYDSFEDNLERRLFFEDSIVTIADVFDHLIQGGMSRKRAENLLLDLLQKKRNSRVFSDCYIPLMVEGEVVGYIRLVNDLDYHRSIKPNSALRAAQYAGILVEALGKYDYFSLESGKEFDIPVINISAGGLLFRLDAQKHKQYLMLRTVLQMSLRFPDRQIEVRGCIHRINEQGSEYGVKFEEINEVDVQYIDEMVRREVSL
jgi:hypothetical protein